MCTINLFIYTQFGVLLDLYSVNTPVFPSFFERATFLLLRRRGAAKHVDESGRGDTYKCGSWKSHLASTKNKREIKEIET